MSPVEQRTAASIVNRYLDDELSVEGVIADNIREELKEQLKKTDPALAKNAEFLEFLMELRSLKAKVKK